MEHVAEEYEVAMIVKSLKRNKKALKKYKNEQEFSDEGTVVINLRAYAKAIATTLEYYEGGYAI